MGNTDPSLASSPSRGNPDWPTDLPFPLPGFGVEVGMLTGLWPETEQSSAGQGEQSHLPETTGMVTADLRLDEKAFQYKAKGGG